MHYIISFFQQANYAFFHKTNYMLDVTRCSSAQQMQAFKVFEREFEARMDSEAPK
jgi:hypothetical protein